MMQELKKKEEKKVFHDRHVLLILNLVLNDKYEKMFSLQLTCRILKGKQILVGGA